ncbi:T9SS type A sorting domain-containing protein [Flavobacterium sp. 3HN19-14]|uniref:T9SS type A sorting domain-containing protein n=1 Tax=Flavobacterium sp. 3HN19-14 TaxID=3448133 RepID=UPI003EE33C35
MENRIIDLVFHVFPPPASVLGDQVISTVSITPVSGDATLPDNTFELHQTVIGSWDPNDITCLEGSQVPIQNANEYLHYLVRFQNTGTADAANVTVRMLLDNKLNWPTMQIESMSHNGRTEIKNAGEVTFTFNNINLPDSTTNEAGSHGFIAFKVKPMDIMVGNIVSNTARIFFDSNPPVTTNTATTQFVQTLSVSENEAGSFTLYPNPVDGILNIEGKTTLNEIVLLDTNGRILKEIRFETPSPTARIDLSDLTTGIYLLKIKSEAGYSNQKIIKR